jgi:DNA-binding response OmpR family regulator
MNRLLVVDDDEDILDAVELMLTVSGYEVKTISDGHDIYNEVIAYRPNAIILDYLLSGSNGVTICQELKAMDATRDIPVIMFSAHPSARTSAEQAGVDSFVPKPFSMNELLTEVGRHARATC